MHHAHSRRADVRELWPRASAGILDKRRRDRDVGATKRRWRGGRCAGLVRVARRSCAHEQEERFCLRGCCPRYGARSCARRRRLRRCFRRSGSGPMWNFLRMTCSRDARPARAGHEIAARYTASQFEASGLKPGGENGSWYQPITLQLTTRGAEPAWLAINGPAGEQRFDACGQRAGVAQHARVELRDCRAAGVRGLRHRGQAPGAGRLSRSERQGTYRRCAAWLSQRIAQRGRRASQRREGQGGRAPWRCRADRHLDAAIGKGHAVESHARVRQRTHLRLGRRRRQGT